MANLPIYLNNRQLSAATARGKLMASRVLIWNATANHLPEPGAVTSSGAFALDVPSVWCLILTTEMPTPWHIGRYNHQATRWETRDGVAIAPDRVTHWAVLDMPPLLELEQRTGGASPERIWVELWNLLDRVETYLRETAPDMLLTHDVYRTVIAHNPGFELLHQYSPRDDTVADGLPPDAP